MLLVGVIKAFVLTIIKMLLMKIMRMKLNLNGFMKNKKRKNNAKKHSQNELSDFIRYITNHIDFRKKEIIKHHYLPDEDFSPEFEREM